MSELLLRLLLWRDALGAGTPAGFDIPRALPALILAAAGAWLAAWAYRREAGWLAPRRRRALLGLRLAAVAVAAVAASGLALAVDRPPRDPGAVVVLLDRSASMRLPAGDAPGSRDDLLRAVLDDPGRDPRRTLAGRARVEVHAIGVDGSLALLAGAPPPCDLPASPLGAALAAAGARRPAAAVLISDGGWNRGAEPVAAAQALAAPVIALGTGAAEPPGLDVAAVACAAVARAGESHELAIRLRHRGLAGSVARLAIRRIDGGEATTRDVALDGGAETELRIAVPSGGPATTAWRVEAEALPGETFRGDNLRFSPEVEVVDAAVAVLLLEEAPRWEFRRLHAALAAAPTRFAVTAVVRQAGPGSGFATRPPERLDGFDAIVLGDLAPSACPPGFAQVLEDWVGDGGGLLLLAGRQALPAAWGAALDRLLPVLPAPEAPPWSGAVTAVAEGEDGPWRQAGALGWVCPVATVKPAASVLLALDGPGQRPLLAMQGFGRGQSAWLGSDETWRWRAVDPAAHAAWWRRLVAGLGQPRLLAAARPVRLSLDRERPVAGEPVGVVLRRRGPAAAVLPATATAAGLAPVRLDLARRPGQDGVYAATWIPAVPGLHALAVEGEPAAQRLVEVAAPDPEEDDRGQRLDILRGIAAASGGAYLPLERAGELPGVLARLGAVVAPVRETVGLWSAPGLVLLFALALGLEWTLRRRWELT